MRHARQLLNVFLYSNLFISLCAAGLAYETYLLSGVDGSLRMAAIVFFGTMLVYNLDGLLPYKFNQQEVLSERLHWIRENKLLLQTIVMGSILLVLYLYYTALFTLNFWFILHLGVVAGLYSVPFIPDREGNIPLRDVPLLKVFLIAYVWSAITVQLPLMEASHDLFKADSLLLFARRFLFLFALTLVFDIRDVEKDTRFGTVTFPVKWGVTRTKQIAWVALALFALLLPGAIAPLARLALALTAVGAAAIVWKAHEKRNQYYYLVLADGMMLVQVALVWLLTR